MAVGRSVFTKAAAPRKVFTQAAAPRKVFTAVPRLIPENATIEIGTVTTLPPGSPATVTNVGTETAAILNFGLPEGVQGDDGVVQSVVAGSNISVDNTDPANPVISSTSAVTSVNGQTGVVVLDAGDIGFTPAGNIAATDVQAAIAELDTEKQPLDSDLTAIAALSPSNDDIVQRKAGAWTNRTMAQLLADLSAVGTTFQPLDADLTAIAALSGTNTIYYRSAANTWTAVTIGGMLTFSGGTLNIGDAELSAIAGLTSAADRLPYFTGSGTAGLATFTSQARDLLDDSSFSAMLTTLGLSANGSSLVTAANYAAMRALLDLEAGTDFYSISAANAAFQPIDSDLTSWAGVTRASGFDTFAATPSSANLRALLTDETGTGIAYFVGGALGTPSSATLTNATGLPISTGLTGAGTGVLTALGVNVGSAGAFVTFNGALGTPSSGTLTNATGLPISSGVSGLGTNVATFLATPSSANLRAALTDEVGTGAAYFVGGALGQPASADLTNATSLPVAGITASTSTALGVGSVELGHATDTTLSRGAAGFLAVEGKRVPSPASQAAGDILYRGSTEWERLAAGTALQHLRMNAAATAPEWVADREVLTAARTYYVRTDGSNSNTGLANTSGGAFLTIQKAADIAAGLDLNGYTVTVEIQTGTYTAGVNMIGALVGLSGTGALVFNGNTVTVSVTSGTCFRAQYGAKFTVSNMTLTTTTSGNCLSAEAAGSAITVSSGMTFGACAGIHINADSQGRIDISANYTVSGAAGNHWSSGFNGFVVCVGRTITISGTPAFSSAWSNNFDLGLTVAISNTYSGSATGKRYISNTNASTRTSGATFPGDVAGTTDGFGVYT